MFFMNNNIVLSLLSAFLFLFIGTNVNAQENNSRTITIEGKTYIDNGYFKYETTGNTDADAASYQAAKLKFSETDPAGYERWVKSVTVAPLTRYVIDKTEFANMPKDRQDMILANPDKYEIKEINQ